MCYSVGQELMEFSRALYNVYSYGIKLRLIAHTSDSCVFVFEILRPGVDLLMNRVLWSTSDGPRAHAGSTQGDSPSVCPARTSHPDNNRSSRSSHDHSRYLELREGQLVRTGTGGVAHRAWRWCWVAT
ncbi:hypothetical protein Pcinc_007802 [Petrolisthes cinctipes]|uniref:Uncharacterized protein n=1 Tax=Petrolisthes cinctipes TaxID=88211 RepID=A0AAE1G8P7_PETCI|nr:hypothetical protein Pcinc_007802 [Petrolisthes cinctipes]